MLTLEEYRAGKRPTAWGVFEREPRQCKDPDSIVFGPYKTEADAELARMKYYGESTNYYVKLFEQ